MVANKATLTKLSALSLAKLPIAIKLSIAGAAIFVTSAVTGLPVHDFWFNWVLFIIISAIIGGMPPPETELPFWKFMYMWIYRSGHLLVASAAAFLLHQRRVDEISESEKRKDSSQGKA